MNHFAGYIILCHASLDEFLDMGPDSRSEMFGAFVGYDRLVSLNVVCGNLTEVSVGTIE